MKRKYLVFSVLCALGVLLLCGCAPPAYEPAPTRVPKLTPEPEVYKIQDVFVTSFGQTRINIVTSTGEILKFRLYYDDVKILYEVPEEEPMRCEVFRGGPFWWNKDKVTLHVHESFRISGE